jgi:hypothetical protein
VSAFRANSISARLRGLEHQHSSIDCPRSASEIRILPPSHGDFDFLPRPTPLSFRRASAAIQEEPAGLVTVPLSTLDFCAVARFHRCCFAKE